MSSLGVSTSQRAGSWQWPHLNLLLILQQRSLHDVAELEGIGLNLEGMPSHLEGQHGLELLTRSPGRTTWIRTSNPVTWTDNMD